MQERTPTSPKATVTKAVQAYAAFAVLLCGSFMVALKLLPDNWAANTVLLSFMVWGILYMAAVQTALNFSRSFVIGYLVPGVVSSLISIAFIQLISTVGFTLQLIEHPDIGIAMGSIALIALMGSICSALVRIFIWSGFEMIPTRFSSKRD